MFLGVDGGGVDYNELKLNELLLRSGEFLYFLNLYKSMYILRQYESGCFCMLSCTFVCYSLC